MWRDLVRSKRLHRLERFAVVVVLAVPDLLRLLTALARPARTPPNRYYNYENAGSDFGLESLNINHYSREVYNSKTIESLCIKKIH